MAPCWFVFETHQQEVPPQKMFSLMYNLHRSRAEMLCWFLAGNEAMTPIKHPLWLPLRETLGSFPNPGTSPTEQQRKCQFCLGQKIHVQVSTKISLNPVVVLWGQETTPGFLCTLYSKSGTHMNLQARALFLQGPPRVRICSHQHAPRAGQMEA